MTELLTAAQMRAIEAAAIASGAVTGLELMERAGRGVVEAVFAEWPELAAGSFRAVVLCGPGNNGGDGFVVARLLKEWGWEVEVFLYGTPDRMPPDARVNYERWVGMGEVKPLTVFRDVGNWKAAILIDALFGTGLTRPIEGFELLFREIIDCVDGGLGRPLEPGFEAQPMIISVDIPSGLCADSGKIIAPGTALDEPRWSLKAYAIRAHLTVTFHRQKRGLVLGFGPTMCGNVRVVDIGI